MNLLTTLALPALALSAFVAATLPQSSTGTAPTARPAAAVPAAAATYAIDGVHSCALFRVQHLGAGQFWGRFNDVSGTFAGASYRGRSGGSSFDAPGGGRRPKLPAKAAARMPAPTRRVRGQAANEEKTDRGERADRRIGGPILRTSERADDASRGRVGRGLSDGDQGDLGSATLASTPHPRSTRRVIRYTLHLCCHRHNDWWAHLRMDEPRTRPITKGHLRT